MIYLICAQDSKTRIAEVSKESELKSHFWEYVLSLTEHKNFLYSYSFYTKLVKQPLPNRVNVVFSFEKKNKMTFITNAIMCNSFKQILSSYKDKRDDVYILANRTLMEAFAGYADFLIVYQTNELTCGQQLLPDTINFADYNLLSQQEKSDFKISHFVRVPNFLRR